MYLPKMSIMQFLRSLPQKLGKIFSIFTIESAKPIWKGIFTTSDPSG